MGLFGLLIGSFLNVVIYRLPRGESVIYPRSHCPQCGHILGVRELIPIFSYILLNGRCKQCGAKISFQYPIVEFLTGCLYFLVSFQSGEELNADTVFKLIFVTALIALAFIDKNTMLLPDRIVCPLLMLGVIRGLLLGNPPIGSGLLSAIGAGGFFAMIAFFYPQGMGWGDVKLVAGLGTFLGFPYILLSIFIASVTGAVFGFIVLMRKKEGLKKEIPFGPYLALGAVIALLWGEKILIFYS